MQVTVSAATLTFRLPEFEPLVPFPLVTPTELVALKVKALGLPAVSAGTGQSWKSHSRMYSSVAPVPEVWCRRRSWTHGAGAGTGVARFGSCTATAGEERGTGGEGARCY